MSFEATEFQRIYLSFVCLSKRSIANLCNFNVLKIAHALGCCGCFGVDYEKLATFWRAITEFLKLFVEFFLVNDGVFLRYR